MKLECIFPNLYRLHGSVSGGLLIRDGFGLLIDAPELPAEEKLQVLLAEAGVHTVEQILLTQHRRQFCGGVLAWEGERPPVFATAPEAELLQRASDVWERNQGRYHRYRCIPDQFLPLESVPISGVICNGQCIVWRGFTITPVVFGALSHGDCVYLVEDGVHKVAFCGGLIMADGQIHDLYSLQKALPSLPGYHGFLGGLPTWRNGMRCLMAHKPELLLPAYGPVESEPENCVEVLERRLLDYAEAYARTNSCRNDFAEEYRTEFLEVLGLTPYVSMAPETDSPSWLLRLGETTSFLLRSDNGRGILIDVGEKEAVDLLRHMRADGVLTRLDACWITHYHDDHLNALWTLTTDVDADLELLPPGFGCEILTTPAVAEVIRQPAAWYLPAMADCNVCCRTVEDGYTWEWEDFRLTAYDMPGHCVAHSGLLVERDGIRIFLTGDNFSRAGIDDYCPGNRNLPGSGRGYQRCLNLLEKAKVHWLVSQHHTKLFHFDDTYLRFLRSGIKDRERLQKELFPSNAGLGLDPLWLRAWPLEQTVRAGSCIQLNLQLTGHGAHTVRVSPRLPWDRDATLSTECRTAGLTSGSVSMAWKSVPKDYWLAMDLEIPQNVSGRYCIPFDCWLDDCYLGTFTMCFLDVL